MNASQLVERQETDQELIIGALQALRHKLKSEDIDRLLAVVMERAQFNNVQIELYEAKGDYVSAFKCLLQEKEPEKVFAWTQDKFEKLRDEADTKGDVNYEPLQNFKNAVKSHMRELANLEYERQVEDDVKRPKKKPSLSKTTAESEDETPFC